MRVAVDAENLAQDRRGMGRHVRAILCGLAGHGIEPTLVCAQRGVPLLQELMPLARVSSVREAKSNRYDAAWFPWNGMRFDLHAPSVLTIHDVFAFDEPQRNAIARFREQRPISRGVREAVAIATVSRWSARRIEARFGLRDKPLHVVPPVLDSFWSPRRAQDKADPFIVFVAGPEPRKNAEFLFEAFERARFKNRVRLTIVGSLSQHDEAVLASKHFAYERLRATDEELALLYSQAVAVAVPSRSEGYGLVPLEAMACGAPVLASNAAALPESCADAALMIDPRDAEGWTSAMQRVAGDSALREDLRRRSLQRASAIDRAAPSRVMAELLLALR